MDTEQLQKLVDAAEVIIRWMFPGRADRNYTYAASLVESLIVTAVDLFGALDGFADEPDGQ